MMIIIALQKMMLTRNRIWGNIVGEGVRSGYKELRRPLKGPALMTRYEHARLDMMFPFVKDWSITNLRKEKY